MTKLNNIDFNDTIAFVRVVESGSFSGAARIIGTTKSNVSKQISRLEVALKSKLLHRSTRQVSVTEVGQEVYRHSVRILEESKAIQSITEGMQSRPSGLLRISTSMAFGTMHLAHLLPEFSRLYPDIRITLSLNDRYVELVEEGFDVVLRLTSTLKMLSVVARPIAPLNYVLVASPEYLKRNGIPQNIESLAEGHQCLTFGESNSSIVWNFIVDGGQASIKVNSVLSINSSASLRIAMLKGAGIALLPTFAVGADIKQGDAIIVLPEIKAIGSFGNTLYAVYLENRFLPPKVRVFIDFLIERIGSTPYWDAF